MRRRSEAETRVVWTDSLFDAGQTDSGAEARDLAMFAIRVARKTAPAAVPDQEMAQQSPIWLRDQLHQDTLNFFRRFFTCQT
jgi:hypothetical protein